MYYMYTKFGVDSSSRFSFRTRTYRQAHKHTYTQTQLNIVPTTRLPPALVNGLFLKYICVTLFSLSICRHNIISKWKKKPKTIKHYNSLQAVAKVSVTRMREVSRCCEVVESTPPERICGKWGKFWAGSELRKTEVVPELWMMMREKERNIKRWSRSDGRKETRVRVEDTCNILMWTYLNTVTTTACCRSVPYQLFYFLSMKHQTD